MRLLWGILSVALFLRICFCFTLEAFSASSDEQHWDATARFFLEFGIWHPDGGAYRPPLYSIVLTILYALFGGSVWTVRIFQAVIGTASCGILFVLGRKLEGQRVGLVAAGLGAILPIFVFFSNVVMAETLLVFLTVLCLSMISRLENDFSYLNACLFGVVLGASVLCKPVLASWIPFLCWGWFRYLKVDIGRILGRLTMLLVVAAFTVFPWTIRNYLVTGYWIPVSANLGMNLMVGNEPDATGFYQDEMDYISMLHRFAGPVNHAVEADRMVASKMAALILENPGRFAILAVRKLVLYWRPWVFGEPFTRNVLLFLSSGPVLLLGLWGILCLWPRCGIWPIGFLVLSQSMVHMIFFVHLRFRMPVEAALICPAAWMLVKGWDFYWAKIRT